jgi:sulfur transfer complex TusBCD TusB component (DsrH family)
VAAIKDDVLARKIAEKIGQDIIAVAAKSGIKKAVEQLGVKNSDLLKNAEDIFK